MLSSPGGNLDFGFELELDPKVGPGGLAPGASGAGRVSFWAMAELPSLFAGQRFELREGARVIGRGTIDPRIGEREKARPGGIDPTDFWGWRVCKDDPACRR